MWQQFSNHLHHMSTILDIAYLNKLVSFIKLTPFSWELSKRKICDDMVPSEVELSPPIFWLFTSSWNDTSTSAQRESQSATDYTWSSRWIGKNTKLFEEYCWSHLNGFCASSSSLAEIFGDVNVSSRQCLQLCNSVALPRFWFLEK